MSSGRNGVCNVQAASLGKLLPHLADEFTYGVVQVVRPATRQTTSAPLATRASHWTPELTHVGQLWVETAALAGEILPTPRLAQFLL